MPIREGWEWSPNGIKMYEKILSTDPVGDILITSKYNLDRQYGFLVVSNSGFAWRIKIGYNQLSGKSKWVRWYDVANIIPRKPGQIVVEIKIRKNGSLILDKKGNPKIKKWKLTMKRNKNEDYVSFKQRLETFNQIILEIFNRNKVETDPPISDSRI